MTITTETLQRFCVEIAPNGMSSAHIRFDGGRGMVMPVRKP